jgi:hypothetical protein
VKLIACAISVLVIVACKRADNSVVVADSASHAPADAIVSHDTTSESHTCGISGLPVVTEQGLGDLRIGRSVEDVRKDCEVVSDGEEQGIEGMPERVVVTRIAGETVRSVVVEGRIWRLEISSPHFRTADSLGVDTPLRNLARMKGAEFFPGEDGVYGFVASHCGLSFRFAVPMRPPKGGQWTAERIEKAHGDAAVNRILVTRCER